MSKSTELYVHAGFATVAGLLCIAAGVVLILEGSYWIITGIAFIVAFGFMFLSGAAGCIRAARRAQLKG